MVDVTDEEVPCARQCCSDACALGYVSMSDHVANYSLYDWEDASYARKDEIHLVWEGTGKVCSESGKRIYFRIYCDCKT